MAQHVENDAAAIFFAIVPGRPLRRHGFALEHPVAEFAAHGKNPAEESLALQMLQLLESGQPEFILHHAVLHSGAFGQAVEL